MGNNGRVFGGGILFWIVFLLALIFSVGFCQAAVSHDFNTTITVTPSTGGGLMIDLIEPAAAVFSGISEISFRAVVTYNRSIGLWCNLSLDNSVLASLEILDGQELILENITTVAQGNHSWLMSCTDELNNNYTSSIKQFVVDLEAPSIYLNKEDPALSLIDAIRLNFTVTDNIATSLLCNLSASGRGVNNVYAAAGLVINVTLAGLDNGDYFWNVSCVDTAGNLNISKNKKFIINTQSNFTIKRNKDLYTLGESGIYILEAPQGSQITIVITTPKLTTVIRNYVGPYPVIDNISFAEYEGTYLIQGFLNYMGAIKTIESSFEVKNTLETSIRLDRNTILRGESISFSSHSSGGLGGTRLYLGFWRPDSNRYGRICFPHL